MPRIQTHREIAVGSPLGEDALLLRGVSITEALGRPFQIELDLLSEDAEIAFDRIVGQNVTVRIMTSGGEPRYFNGFVSRFCQARLMDNLTEYQATVVPWIWFLTRTSDCRIFQDMTAPDIIMKVFRDRGLTDFKSALTGRYRPWEYCVQYRETDFNFVTRLMEQEGIYYYFEHSNGSHRLVLADSPSCHGPFAGYEQITYRPPEHQIRESEYVWDWTVEQEVQPGKYAHNDFDFKSPKKALLTTSQIQRRHAVAGLEIYDYPGEFTEFGDGERYARVRIEEHQAKFEAVRGQGDVRGVSTGCKFNLTGFPREDQCRDYLVTSARILARSDEFEAAAAGGEGGGFNFSCSFTAIPANEQFRLARITPKPGIDGPQTAIVVGKSGEEIWTDQYGRVKVQFHWDRRGKYDENSSCWIRVAQVWAGKKWGGIFIPRIGQEVIVEFLEGDPDQPIITGRVYNGEVTVPYALPDNATRSTIKSNSTKGGGGFNEIRIEDKKDSEQIFIHAQKDQDNRVKNDSKEWVGNERHLIVKKSQLELVEQDKHLHVKGDQKEKVDGAVSHKTGTSWDQKVGTKHAVDAGQEIHLKAGMKVILEAGMQLTIKAAGGFVDIGPAGVTIQGILVKINSGGSAGSGSGSSPKDPQDPKEADSDKPGEVSQVPPATRHEEQTITLSSTTVGDFSTGQSGR